MTNEEAKATLLIEYCDLCEGSITGACRKENCEIYIAIKALEKQIPKKPKGIYFTPSRSYRLGNCSCGALIHEYISFCPKCGQKLDWSDNA